MGSRVSVDVRNVYVRILPKEFEKIVVIDRGAVVDFELEIDAFTLKLHRVRVAGALTSIERRGDMVEALLSDEEGTARVRAWDRVADALSSFRQEDFIEVLGNLRVYRGELYVAANIVRGIGSEGFDSYLELVSRDRRILLALHARSEVGTGSRPV